MIGAVVENIIGGYLHPRSSVRRLLAAGHGFDAALQMLLLGYLIGEIFMIITPGARPDEAPGPSFGHIVALFEALVRFAILAALVCFVGRLFGGRGNLRQTAVVLAWYTLVTSFVVPLFMPALQQVFAAASATAADPSTPVSLPAASAVIVLATSGLFLWLLAAYIAELHGFSRTIGVLSAILGAGLVLSLLVSSVVPIG